MAEYATSAEWLRIALEMEIRGRNLYLRAKEMTTDGALIALLSNLADEEANHYKRFEGMFSALGTDISPEESALAASKTADFFYPGGLMEVAFHGGMASLSAMLEEAIRAEEQSIDVYTKVMEGLQGPERATVEGIIQEEKAHLRTLQARK
ncbi:rubrerythrin [Clostridia bacterium]|nr:rubrerythrin [Clostridia bacterium]